MGTMRRRTISSLIPLVALLAISACAKSQAGTDQAAPATSVAPAPQQPAPAITSVPDSEFTLAFAGDVHFEAGLRGLLDDPAHALDPVAPLLSAADLTMVNLETAITTRGTAEPKDYTFRTSPAALDALAAAGVDVVSIANNHGLDYGDVGFADTLAARASSPVEMVGIGRDAAEAYAPYVATISGTDVAFLAATVAPEPTTDAWAATDAKGGLATAVDPTRLLAAVRAASVQSDLVVVYMHWGDELVDCPTGDQLTLRAALADAGADVVLGAHAHLQLGAGWTADGTYVGYGLGNFVWYHGRTEAVASTGVLTLTVRNGEVVDHAWSPATIPTSGGVPTPLTGGAAESARARWADLRTCADLSPTPPIG